MRGLRGLLWIGLVVLGGSMAVPAAAQHQVTGPSADVPPLPSGDATLRGRVLHADGRALPDLDVALYALAPDGRPGIGGAKTDAEGRFVFEGISGAPGVVYLIGVRWAEIPYGQRAAFADGQTEVSVDVEVSDPVADASALLVMQTVVQTEWIGAQLFVQVVHHLRNADEGVIYIAEDARDAAAPVFRAALPENARDFIDGQSGMGIGLVRDGDALTFWGPVYPGDQQIRYGFLLDGPVSGSQATTLDFALPFPAGSGNVSLLVPTSDTAPVGDRMPETFLSEEQEGSTLRRYSLGGVEPGGEIALSAPLPASSSDANRLAIARADFWVDHDDTAMRVTAEYNLRVSSPTRLLAPAGEALMHITLPEGAEFLGLSGSARAMGVVADESGGLEVRGPIQHGDSALGFRYRVPVDSDAARLDLQFDRPAARLNVMVADNGVAIETDRLHRRRPFKQGTRIYLHNEAFQIAADERVHVVLRPLRARALPRGVALASGLLAAAFAAVLLAAPLRGAAVAMPGSSESAQSVERASLYASIRDLDHDFETGKLEQDEYEPMRADLRAEAIDLLRQERSAAAANAAASQPDADQATCSACARPVQTGWQFCSHCGHDLRDHPGGPA